MTIRDMARPLGEMLPASISQRSRSTSVAFISSWPYYGMPAMSVTLVDCSVPCSSPGCLWPMPSVNGGVCHCELPLSMLTKWYVHRYPMAASLSLQCKHATTCRNHPLSVPSTVDCSCHEEKSTSVPSQGNVQNT